MVRRRRLCSSSVSSWASVIPAAWMTPRIGAAPSASRLATSACTGLARTDVEGHGIDRDPTHFQRPDGGDLVPRLGVGAVAVPVATWRQRSAAGQYQTTCAAVREPTGHQQTERTHTTGDQVCRIRAAPQRLANRFAGDRHQLRREEFAVTQRQDGLGRCPQNRGQRRYVITDVCLPSGMSTRPPHNCGCSARTTPAVPHRSSAATAASELPSRTPRVMIHSVTGWSSSRSASPRTRSATSADRRTAQSMSVSSHPDSAT